MLYFSGERYDDGVCHAFVIHETHDHAGNQVKITRHLPLRVDLRNHSPAGFEWGYAGSGPAQLALAILAEHLRDQPEGDQHAVELHQDFKFAFVAAFPSAGWRITAEAIDEWLANQVYTVPEYYPDEEYTGVD